MSDMYMSDTEIAIGYRTAKNKAKQVGVLSHVRLVSEYGQAGEPLLRVEMT